MVEFLFMAQLVRNPLQAMARRWYCRSLCRATRGRRRCAECTNASSENFSTRLIDAGFPLNNRR
jgi:hypothetical protein